MANYFVIGMKQLGKDIFEIKDGNVTFNVDKEAYKTSVGKLLCTLYKQLFYGTWQIQVR